MRAGVHRGAAEATRGAQVPAGGAAADHTQAARRGAGDGAGVAAGRSAGEQATSRRFPQWVGWAAS